MDYELRDHGIITLLLLKGDLPFQEIEELGSILHHIVHDTSGEIVVDLSKVGYTDHLVAGQFVAAKREADIKRRAFVLANPSPSVKTVLHSAHADNLVRLYDSTEEAIADLAEKARGGNPRKIIPDIKCGHEDCIFYTFAKVHGEVTAACEYSYPDQITNDPSCRCYRVNWKQFQETNSAAETPFPRAKKRESLYRARDTYYSDSGEEQPQMPNPLPARSPYEVDAERTDREAPSFEPASSSSELNDTPQNQTSSTQTEFQVPAPVQLPPEEVPDPFADDNYPSLSETQQQAAPPPMPETPPPPPPPEPKPLTPEEVVSLFVESWNDNRFDLEYSCLASKNRVFSEEDYFSRRRTLKNSQVEKHKRSTRQSVSRVDSTAIQGDHATVEITRLDRTPRGARCYCQHYTLILEEKGWKIHLVEDGEERKNPTVPPKGRKMRADSFLGKSSKIAPKKPGTIV